MGVCGAGGGGGGQLSLGKGSFQPTGLKLEPAAGQDAGQLSVVTQQAHMEFRVTGSDSSNLAAMLLMEDMINQSGYRWAGKVH